MGTRSTTHFKCDGEHLVSLYKQYDGYIDGWGKEIKEFFNSGKFVNGLPCGSKDTLLFNGFMDFVALLISHFKEGSGGLYITTKGDRQEYNYFITCSYDKDTKETTIRFVCEEDSSYDETFTFKI